jgi:hypothetical protein
MVRENRKVSFGIDEKSGRFHGHTRLLTSDVDGCIGGYRGLLAKSVKHGHQLPFMA